MKLDASLWTDWQVWGVGISLYYDACVKLAEFDWSFGPFAGYMTIGK